MHYVYVLICKDKRTYTGCTNNLKDRLQRHNNGYIEATKNRIPVTLKSYFAFDKEITAFNFEKYLKSGSGRAFMKKYLL
jgi:predicted GIY-YIG superfamily endonuclease